MLIPRLKTIDVQQILDLLTLSLLNRLLYGFVSLQLIIKFKDMFQFMSDSKL